MSSAPPEAQDLALFHRALAELCRSELPLPRALRLLEGDIGRAPLRVAVRAMADDVESGTPIAEAYAARAGQFPSTYRALVEAGIAAGDLAGVLDEIAAHAAHRADVAAKLRRALAYPMTAAAFLVVIGVALLVFVAPSFLEMSQIIAGQGGESLAARSGSTPEPAGFGGWTPLTVAIGILAVAAAGVAAIMWLRDPLDGAGAGGARRYRFPVRLGPLRHSADLASLASTLSLLVRRRVPLPRALDLAADATLSGPLQARVRAAADAAHEGRGLADSARHAGLFAPSLLWIVEAAERRGDAAGALDDVARIYRERLSRAADRAAVVVTPVAELLVGLAVLLLAYAFLSPLLDFTRRLLC